MKQRVVDLGAVVAERDVMLSTSKLRVVAAAALAAALGTSSGDIHADTPAPSIPTRFVGAVVRAVKTRGVVTEAQATTALEGALPGIKTCVLADEKIPVGTNAMVMATFRVDRAGNVSGIAIDHDEEGDDGLPANGLETCVVRGLRGLTFRASQGPTAIGVALSVAVEKPPVMPSPNCELLPGLDGAMIGAENTSNDSLVFSYSGASTGAFTIAPHGRVTREVPPGAYRFAVRDATDGEVSPAYLQQTISKGYVCGWSFRIVTRPAK